MSYLPKFRNWVQRARQRLAEYRQTIEHELARARNRGLALIAAPHPVVGRYRTIATWRLSFHCGMNAADTSAWQAPPAFASGRVGCDADRLFSCPFRCAKHSAPSRDASSRFALDLARQARQRLIDAGVIIEHEPKPAPDDQPEAEPQERGVVG